MGKPNIRSVDAFQIGQVGYPTLLIDDLEASLLKWTNTGLAVTPTITLLTTQAWSGNQSLSMSSIHAGSGTAAAAERHVRNPRSPVISINMVYKCLASTSSDDLFGIWLLMSYQNVNWQWGFAHRRTSTETYSLTATLPTYTVTPETATNGGTTRWNSLYATLDLSAGTCLTLILNGKSLAGSAFAPLNAGAGSSPGLMRVAHISGAATTLTTIWDDWLLAEA